MVLPVHRRTTTVFQGHSHFIIESAIVREKRPERFGASIHIGKP